MSRAKKLRVLKQKIKNFNSEIKEKEKFKFNKDGRVNMDVVMSIQRINNDIYYAKKQISFLDRGMCYLGEEFESKTITDTKK